MPDQADGSDVTADPPRIAVVTTVEQAVSLSFGELMGSASIHPVWVVDLDTPDRAHAARVLSRAGTLVDSHGKPAERVATDIAEHHPTGIIVLTDDKLVAAAALGRRLGLVAHSERTAVALTDKLMQRTALREAGVPTPGYWAVAGPEDEEGWATVAREATYPAVVKPRISFNSRDVSLVQDLAEAKAAVAGSDPTSSGFIVEEFIRDPLGPVTGEGMAPYLSVETLVHRGEIIHVATNGRPPVAPPFRETGGFIPSELRPDLVPAVLDAATEAIRALGVENGAVHTEVKLSPDGPVVIEVNGRVGGGVREMLYMASGYDIRTDAYRLAQGLAPVATGLVECPRIGYVVLQQASAGLARVGEVRGLEELRELPGVERLEQTKMPGAVINWREGTPTHIFRLDGTVPDHDALRAMIRAAAAVEILPADE